MQRNSTHLLICGLEKRAKRVIHGPVLTGNGQLGLSGVTWSRTCCWDS